LIADGFETARSLVVNAEDNTIYVAGRKDGDNGIWAVSVDGGAVKAIAGSNAWLPQGLDLVEEQQTDMLYFTGTDPGTGDQGVWRVQLPDGAVQAVPGAVPVEAADGVARSTDAVYVVGTGTNGGTLIRIKDGASSKMVDGITLGTPAGIALTLDESTLLVSALADDGSSEVVLVNLDDASVTTFNDVIKANTGSGGVHRAKDENTFVWAGSTNTGTVYKIKLD
jgi:sugar lactone lactonase YvrE